jgi:hypothetical protein
MLTGIGKGVLLSDKASMGLMHTFPFPSMPDTADTSTYRLLIDWYGEAAIRE